MGFAELFESGDEFVDDSSACTYDLDILVRDITYDTEGVGAEEATSREHEAALLIKESFAELIV